MTPEHVLDPLGVVLAAGRGERFGGPKQVAELDGRPLVAHAVQAAVAAGLEVLVVVSADAAGAAVADAVVAIATDARVVANPDPARGMGSSLAVAATATGPRPLVVLLADQPFVPVADIRAVADALVDGADAVQVAYRDGGRGHPVGFGAALHPRLVDLCDEGAGRRLLDDVSPVVIEVDHDRPRDVDTPDDLAALRDAAPDEWP